MLLKIFNSRYHYENYMSIDFLKDAQNLKNIYRQGWIEKLKISSPESVGYHTYFMAIMGMIFSSKTNLNTEKILKMILIHDLAESKIGDLTPEKLPFDEKKDLEPLMLSKEKFEYVLSNYPDTDFAQDAKFKLRAKNFPKQLIDKQKKQKGVEV